MTNTEHAKIVLGVDTGAVAGALRSVENQFSEMGRHIGQMAMQYLSFRALESGVERVAEMAEQLTRLSETTGVGTDLLQGFTRMVALEGSTSEKAAKGLEKLAILIGEAGTGSKEALKPFEKWHISLGTTSEVLFELADRMKGAGNETERAAIAADFFGKKIGPDMIPSLMKGSEAIKQYTESITKMTEAEMASAKAARDVIKETGNWITIGTGKLMGGVAQIARFFGWASTTDVDFKVKGFSDLLTVFSLFLEVEKEEREELERKKKAIEDANKAATDQAKSEAELMELEKERATHLAKLVDLYKKWQAAAADVAKAENDLNNKKADRYLPTLEAVAEQMELRRGRAINSRVWAPTQSALMAQQALGDEERAKFFGAQGNISAAEFFQGRADQLRNSIPGLRSNERADFSQATDHLKSLRENAERLRQVFENNQ